MATERRQIRRLERCVEELVKIHDDGKGNATTVSILVQIRAEIARREFNKVQVYEVHPSRREPLAGV